MRIRTGSLCGAALTGLMAMSLNAHAAPITFAPGDYDNTANTVTGTNAVPVYNNFQASGSFRDIFWWGTAYNGGEQGVGSPDFINSGKNLVSNGGSPSRARPLGQYDALNFTGLRTTSDGASFLTIYDKTPADGVATRNLFNATGGIRISTDILFAPGQHAVSGGIVSLYGEGQDGLALLAHNGGGNNPDIPKFSLVFQQSGLPTTLTFNSLVGTSFIGDTVGGTGIETTQGDHWYRILMDLSVTGDAYTVDGFFYNHLDPNDPNSPLGSLITSLNWTGSLSGPGNALDLTNPGEIGLMASTKESFGDGVNTEHGGTGADPLVDNIGVSFTNFQIPETNVPEPTTLALFGTGLLALFGKRRRRAKA